MDPWPRRESSWCFCPADCAWASTSSIPRRAAPVESRAPHFTRHSIARLLTARESTRSQKSQIDSNSPPDSRAPMIVSTAACPTFLTASRPKRIELPETMNP